MTQKLSRKGIFLLIDKCVMRRAEENQISIFVPLFYGKRQIGARALVLIRMDVRDLTYNSCRIQIGCSDNRPYRAIRKGAIAGGKREN